MKAQKRIAWVVLLVTILFLILNLLPVRPQAKMLNGVRLAVIGDFGQSGWPEYRVARLVNYWNPDAVITTGDNIYPCGSIEDFENSVYPYYGKFIDESIFFPTLGNHDWGYPAGQAWKADEIPLLLAITYLPNNGRYFAKIFGNNLVEIFVIDSDGLEPDGITYNSKQGKWLEEKLMTSTAVYKLVFLHVPPFSSCLFGNNPTLQWPFPKWGADAVFAGHCHYYERIMKNDFPYFINGSGGGLEKTPFEEITEGSVVRFRNNFGAQIIEADDDKMTIKFVTILGKLVDVYEIKATP